VVMANEAGSSLKDILKANEAVNQQAEQAAAAAEEMSASAGELVSAVDSVSAVVEENTAATEQMSAGSSEVTQAIENIASVSEENSAAVEEVSASAEEMSAQVEEVTASAQTLADLARQLQSVVYQFKLDNSSQNTDNEISTFKDAHRKWVERSKRLLNGEEKIAESQIPSDHDCSLGRWYYTRGMSEFGNRPEFKAIESHHHTFHQVLSNLVRSYNNGNLAAAQQSFKELERSSASVINGLDQLARG
jgi:chromosome segregation ATPase